MNFKDVDLYNTKDVVTYVNQELAKGRSQKDIEINDFNVNEKVIKNRLSRRGYKKINNQWSIDMLEENSNNTTNKHTKKTHTTNNEPNNNLKEKEFMNKLLNLDLNKLEKIINSYENKTKEKNIRSGSDFITSIRVDKGVYNIFKLRVKTEGEKVGEVLNKLMIEYINK